MFAVQDELELAVAGKQRLWATAAALNLRLRTSWLWATAAALNTELGAAGLLRLRVTTQTQGTQRSSVVGFLL
jgi:hypothetical protein